MVFSVDNGLLFWFDRRFIFDLGIEVVVVPITVRSQLKREMWATVRKLLTVKRPFLLTFREPICQFYLLFQSPPSSSGQLASTNSDIFGLVPWWLCPPVKRVKERLNTLSLHIVLLWCTTPFLPPFFFLFPSWLFSVKSASSEPSPPLVSSYRWGFIKSVKLLADGRLLGAALGLIESI